MRYLASFLRAAFKIKMADSPSIDAFSRVRTSEPFGVFQNDQLHGLDASNWSSRTVGGGAVAFAANEPVVELSVGTANGDKAFNQTNRYFPYVPGKSQFIKMTGVFNAPKANLKQQWLYGDDLNAMGLELNGITPYMLIRSNTSGAPVDNKKAQSEWNLDTLDGNGPSGITLDFTKVQILVIDFQWLGAGRVRMGFDIDGLIYYAHEFKHANLITTAYTATPSLPLRYYIENTGVTASASTLKQLCCSVESEGGFILPGSEFSTPTRWVNIRTVGTTRAPVLAVRLKNALNGKPNRRTVRVLDGHIFAASANTIFEIAHMHDPTAITANWTDIGPHSGVEYSTNITAVTGNPEHILDGDIVPASPGVGGSGGSSLNIADIISAHSYISQNVESNNSQMFVLYAQAQSGTTPVLAGFTSLEFE